MQPASAESDLALSDDYQRLIRALRRARGFALYIARCNAPVYRAEVVTQLRAALSRPVVDIELRSDEQDPFREIAASADSAPADAALFVYGLERMLPSLTPERSRATAAWVNWRREAYQTLDRPLVLWLPAYAVSLLARTAPDFFDWNSGIYEFDLPEPYLPPILHATTSTRDINEFINQDERQKREYLNLLLSLEKEYRGDSVASRQARGRIAYRLSHLYWNMGSYSEARAASERSAREFEAAGDVPGQAGAWSQLAWLEYAQGEPDEALAILETRILPTWQQLNDQREFAIALGLAALILQDRGDYDGALQLVQQGQLPVFRLVGDIRSEATTLGTLARILQLRGDIEGALRIRREEQLPLLEQLGDVGEKAIVLGEIAGLLIKRGDLDEALPILRQDVLPEFERMGDKRGRAVTLERIATVLQHQGDFDEALRILQQDVLPVYERMGDVYARSITLDKIAGIWLAQGNLDQAIRIQLDQVPILERLKAGRDLIVARTNLATALNMRRQEGDREQAVALLHQALHDAETMRLPEREQIRRLLEVYDREQS